MEKQDVTSATKSLQANRQADIPEVQHRLGPPWGSMQHGGRQTDTGAGLFCFPAWSDPDRSGYTGTSWKTAASNTIQEAIYDLLNKKG